ncbi:MAG: trigger factor family protein [Bacteroidia bacterium]|nr:trigger factor family protein [Bacteroidia bacterium]
MSTQLRYARPYLAEGEIAVPAAAYESAYREQLRKLRRELVLPGFRPGQVPVEVVIARHGEAVLAEIVTQQFIEALDKALEGRRLVGFPYYHRHPEKYQVQPPYVDYHYHVQALVVPAEPLPLRSVARVRYTYQAQADDVALYQRILRMAFGELEPVEILPDVLPADKELLVRLRWEAPGAREPIRLSWNTLLQPFPWSLLAGKKPGDKVLLPAAALSTYAEYLRTYLPEYSPLTAGDAEAVIVSAAYARPLDMEALKKQLDFSGFQGMSEEEIWQALLQRHIERILREWNTRAHQTALLHAADVHIPAEIVQYNYLIYLRQRTDANGHLRSYEEYQMDIAWQVLFASYAYNEPELRISDEELEAQVWEKIKRVENLSPETQALLEKLETSDEERKAFLATFVENQGESLRQAMQVERFNVWLENRLGPPQERPVPANMLFLRVL